MSDLVPPPVTSGKSLMERLEDALLPLINLVFLLLMFFIVAGQLSDTPLPDLPGTADQRG
ncbi:MAG: biopolymer transporter ExbD, partial [Marinobacter sp.]|nr:biopolymer transporter ExbD [Marinobacter sp.]